MTFRQGQCTIISYFITSRKKTEENATELVNNILENQLGIEDAKEIKIDRAHRMGTKKHGSKPRAIVAKFNYFPDKQRILSNVKKLKGTGIAISEQFPGEIVATIKRLYPEMKKARDAGRKTKLVRDKLYIDGQLFREPSPTTPAK